MERIERWVGAIALVVVMLLLWVGLAGAQESALRDVTLRWQRPANAAETGPLTFRLYRTPLGRAEEAIELGPGSEGAGGEMRATVAFLRDEAYRVTVSAIGPGGESPRSNPVDVWPVPEAPGRLEIVLEVQGSAVRILEVRPE